MRVHVLPKSVGWVEAKPKPNTMYNCPQKLDHMLSKKSGTIQSMGAVEMSVKRKRHSAQFKFQVALEAIKNDQTINQLASERGVHPGQISQWKRQLLEEGAGVFNTHLARQMQEQESVQAELYEQIGRLKMELEWVKKKAPRGH
jgi:transposase